jgi:hypothetical protein
LVFKNKEKNGKTLFLIGIGSFPFSDPLFEAFPSPSQNKN